MDARALPGMLARVNPTGAACAAVIGALSAPLHPATSTPIFQVLALRDVNTDFTLDAMLRALPTGLTALEVAGCVFKDDRGEDYHPPRPAEGGWSSGTRAWARLPHLRRLVISSVSSEGNAPGSVYGFSPAFRQARSGPWQAHLFATGVLLCVRAAGAGPVAVC